MKPTRIQLADTEDSIRAMLRAASRNGQKLFLRASVQGFPPVELVGVRSLAGKIYVKLANGSEAELQAKPDLSLLFFV